MAGITNTLVVYMTELLTILPPLFAFAVRELICNNPRPVTGVWYLTSAHICRMSLRVTIFESVNVPAPELGAQQAVMTRSVMTRYKLAVVAYDPNRASEVLDGTTMLWAFSQAPDDQILELFGAPVYLAMLEQSRLAGITTLIATTEDPVPTVAMGKTNADTESTDLITALIVAASVGLCLMILIVLAIRTRRRPASKASKADKNEEDVDGMVVSVMNVAEQADNDWHQVTHFLNAFEKRPDSQSPEMGSAVAGAMLNSDLV